MNGTPRLRSAFPSTPSTNKDGAQNASTKDSWSATKPQSSIQTSPGNQNAPLIPFSVLDAPSQRLYISILYLGLTTWRLYDFFAVISDDNESLWLFMKWVAIDSAVLYGLPGLRIPWLQWSSSTTMMLVFLHGIVNAILMFRIPIPLQAWLVALTRVLYDRELAVSERSVKPASVLHNASLILGKQIIHILPEGSAILNPDKIPLCIGNSGKSVTLPIRFNQTDPMLVELLHVDFGTKLNRTIRIRGKELRKYKKHAKKDNARLDNSTPWYIHVPIKETGLYRMSKVIDESELEVQRRPSDTLVVKCPSAAINEIVPNRCRNDLSNFEMMVEGVPPLKLQYSKTVNRKDRGHTSLTISPPEFNTPLVGEPALAPLIAVNLASKTDLNWACNQSIQVPINESLSTSGHWQYAIEKVEDACGNIVSYSSSTAGHTPARKSSEGGLLNYEFVVHERPRAELQSCDAQHEIKAQKGEKKELSVRITAAGLPVTPDSLHYLSYNFTPADRIRQNQEHTEEPFNVNFSVGKASPNPNIIEPGLYSLMSIESEFCTGQIREPATCLLSNPPEPDIDFKHTVIPDRCDGKSVGLSLDLELTGSPPFRIGYSTQRDGGSVTYHIESLDRHHGQMELRPSIAGHYTYRFDSISDAVYRKPRATRNGGMILEQDIIPPASARLMDTGPHRKACIGLPLTFDVEISGQGAPFMLEYELLHNGRRRRPQTKTFEDTESQTNSITTEVLNDGGEYTLALISIADNTGCRTPLSEEAKVDVALQKPKAAFGQVEGKRTLMALEGRKIDLPLRLQGNPPWELSYGILDIKEAHTAIVYNSNDKLTVSTQGTYELRSVNDATCPGSLEPLAKQFVVQWIPRPTLIVPERETIMRDVGESNGQHYIRNAVCEGDEDATDIMFTGTPPFSLTYDQRHAPLSGSRSSISRSINAGIHAATIRMETAEAGFYDYEFSKLGDYSYNHNAQKFEAVFLRQQVYTRPSARFAAAGKTYKYCKEEQVGDEFVPIILEGRSPFDLELEIKHPAMRRPEILKLRNIEADPDSKKRKDYMFQIPHKLLALGNHVVTIRKVIDANGCQRNMDLDAPHVQVSVADIPSIAPLEAQVDYCVGDRIVYTLAGTPPFNVYYTFQGHERKASAPTTNFRRLAEKPGEFTINAVSDQRSTEACKAKVHFTNMIHEMPSVRVSKGNVATTDIHEGGEAEILFEFGGTPPFEFIYTRSTNPSKGKRSHILETKSDVSYDYEKKILASDEGTYEVVSIKDRYCSFSTQKVTGKSGAQKMLTYH